MSSPVLLPSPDDFTRRQAIDPTRSFTVRAPAGSGKTELLIQRYLGLLARVERPEAIVAITFTKKAAGEMLGRVLDALREANAGEAVEQPHKRLTRELALAALARDRELGWHILEHAGRLRIQTIDSLGMSIAGEMPWLSRLGAMPRIEEDTRALYREAARQTLLEVADQHNAALETVLVHLDNNAASARNLIAQMLAKREQWLPMVHLSHGEADEEDRLAMEEALERTIARRLREADELIPLHLRSPWMDLAKFGAAHREDAAPALIELNQWPPADGENLDAWQALADFVLTKDGFRKTLNKNHGFMPHHKARRDEALDLIRELSADERLLPVLLNLRKLPSAHYSDEQWNVLRSLLHTLKLAAAQLRLIFREHGVIDFAELSLAANHALGSAEDPTDLAYRLDSRIEHLLVDEFQDTSRAQFDLLRKLTADWQDGGARTLFLVGDPMQSIYRFRQAEVGLFMAMEQTGLGAVRPQSLSLTVNHRSAPAILERVNHLFTQVFPQSDDMETGAVRYSAAQAALFKLDTPANVTAQMGLFDVAADPAAVTCDFFVTQKDTSEAAALEAQCALERIADARAADPTGSIAILVRSRNHLPEIIAALKQKGLAYRAVEIDPLHERTIVRDLLALTRAMLHFADRIAWLSILRAPWCGLTLDDLEALVKNREEGASGATRRTVWECLRDLDALSDDGRARAAGLRDVLSGAFAEQGRWPLRRWVERAWMQLGGPAAIADDAEAMEDAAAYLQLLEQEQRGADLPDLDPFTLRVADMKAPPALDGGELHIMTIHKAKGLEFDTVILPGLGGRTKKDDEELVLFHEWTEEDRVERLIAPVHEASHEAGGDQDILYKYLKSIEAQKSDYERKRLLYVAMTRARKRLHLMGSILEKTDGSRKPYSGSMLRDIWDALTDHERAAIRTGELTPGARASRQLKRIPAGWTPPGMPEPIVWGNVLNIADPHEPSFEWVGQSLRHAGTVVHDFLQSLPPGEWTVPETSVIRAALTHVGVSPHELNEAAQRVEHALRRTLQSERGRWILAGHHDDVHSEYALAAVTDGEVLRGVVDRTFIDEQGTRWVVDFKTSAHEGAGLQKFLDEEQRRYRDQMERYARILQPLGNPVRLGLYFPLLDQWVEWPAEAG